MAHLFTIPGWLVLGSIFSATITAQIQELTLHQDTFHCWHHFQNFCTLSWSSNLVPPVTPWKPPRIPSFMQLCILTQESSKAQKVFHLWISLPEVTGCPWPLPRSSWHEYSSWDYHDFVDIFSNPRLAISWHQLYNLKLPWKWGHIPALCPIYTCPMRNLCTV